MAETFLQIRSRSCLDFVIAAVLLGLPVERGSTLGNSGVTWGALESRGLIFLTAAPARMHPLAYTVLVPPVYLRNWLKACAHSLPEFEPLQSSLFYLPSEKSELQCLEILVTRLWAMAVPLDLSNVTLADTLGLPKVAAA